MKKIVALVLSLVMVLGLATTAFAATTSTGSVATTSVTPVKASTYDLAKAGGSMSEAATVSEIELTTVTGKVVEDVPYYVPNIYSLTVTTAAGATYTDDLYIEVAKADANVALKNNGAYVYLYNIAETTVAAAIEKWATPVAMDSIVLPADDEIDCGDCWAYVKDAQGNDTKVMAPAAYYVSGEDVYYAGGAKFAYFNGEFVSYSVMPAGRFQAHVWDMATVIVKDTDVKGVKVPVTVDCENCEKTFKVVNALAFDNTWVEFVDYQNFDAKVAKDYAGKYFVVLETVAADAPAVEGDKVESAETFDAGIAMYVGMSVMAAAGSAVVLKKKD